MYYGSLGHFLLSAVQTYTLGLDVYRHPLLKCQEVKHHYLSAIKPQYPLIFPPKGQMLAACMYCP